jgi:two-component system cell cycle sensor histidine kinase/response regulator CckA
VPSSLIFKEKKIIVVVLTTTVICIIDLVTPLWYDVWVLYLIPLLFMFQSAKRPYRYSAIVTLLIVAGLFFPHSDNTSLMHAAANRITGIFGGWGVSVLLMQLKRLQLFQKQASDELEKRVEDRTVQLSQANSSLQKENGQRIRAEESLRVSEDRLRIVLDSTADGLLAADTNGKTILANKRFADLWHIPKHLIDSGDENSMLTFVLGQLVDPDNFLRKVKMLYGTTNIDNDILLFKDGRVFERYSAPMIHEGSVIGRVWSFRDVTRQRRVNEMLRRLGGEHRTTLNTVTVGISRVKNRKVQWSNPAYNNMFGYKAEEIMGKDTDFFYADQEDYHRVGKQGYTTLAKGDIYNTEVQMKKKDGTRFWCHITGKAIDIANLAEGSIWILQDISERKRAEEEHIRTQKLESVGILAGGIAHDFNNLLTGILGNLAIARMRLPVDSTVQKPLIQAEKGCEHAAELSHRLVTFSKSSDPIQKTALIQNVVRDTVLLSLSGSNVVPEFTMPDDLPPVLIDEGQIRQVFNILAINAVDAMPNGGQFRVKAEQVSVVQENKLELKSGTYVRITCEDEGEGIPPAFIGKIFDPYFTTKSVGSRKGQGLGLAICHSIIKKHDGAIMVESKPDQGAKFMVYLPVDQTTNKALQTAGEKPMGFSHAPKRILVMDDEAMVSDTLIEGLSSFGYEVYAVPDSKGAVEAYQSAFKTKHSFDVVILDLTIHGGPGGRETIVELQKIDPEVKAIVASGYGDDPVMKNYRYYGFSGTISKPFTLETLNQVIATV